MAQDSQGATCGNRYNVWNKGGCVAHLDIPLAQDAKTGDGVQVPPSEQRGRDLRRGTLVRSKGGDLRHHADVGA